MELRVRRAGGVWIETLKAGGHASAGLYQRQEWEARVNGPQPDLAALAELVGAGSKWHKVLTEPVLAKGLAPIFDSVFRRTVWSLRLPHGALVELALDQGELHQGEVRGPISEVELELKAGNPAALFDFARQLQDKVALRVGNLSKSARGYALYAPQPLSAVGAGPLELASEMTVEQGFRVIMGNCMTHMQGNEQGVMGSNDPESVHQMRIGMRRLRSALRLFDEWVPLPEALQGELDWLAGELGAARDADGVLGSQAPRCAGPWHHVEPCAVRVHTAAHPGRRFAAPGDGGAMRLPRSCGSRRLRQGVERRHVRACGLGKPANLSGDRSARSSSWWTFPLFAQS